MPIITAEEYKARTGISGTDKDAQIQALIEDIEADFLLIRGKAFDGTEETPIYPAGSKSTAAEMLSYRLQTINGNVGTSTESDGKYSHSYDFRRSRGYPDHIVDKIQSFVRAR